MTSIYLDHNATTALDPAVRDEMTAHLGAAPGNPSSIHAFGQEARRAIDKARARVARLIGAQPEEIVFTSGGTEADNLAIIGAVAAAARLRPHLVTTAIEHQAVLNPCRHLARTVGSVTFLPVDHQGALDPDRAVAALRADTGPLCSEAPLPTRTSPTSWRGSIRTSSRRSSSRWGTSTRRRCAGWRGRWA